MVMPVKELRMQLLGDLERFCKGGREKMDKSTKYLIIGAGISGLTFANYIKEDYLIIETAVQLKGEITYGIMQGIFSILVQMNLKNVLLTV